MRFSSECQVLLGCTWGNWLGKVSCLNLQRWSSVSLLGCPGIFWRRWKYAFKVPDRGGSTAYSCEKWGALNGQASHLSACFTLGCIGIPFQRWAPWSWVASGWVPVCCSALTHAVVPVSPCPTLVSGSPWCWRWPLQFCSLISPHCDLQPAGHRATELGVKYPLHCTIWQAMLFSEFWPIPMTQHAESLGPMYMPLQGGLGKECVCVYVGGGVWGGEKEMELFEEDPMNQWVHQSTL